MSRLIRTLFLSVLLSTAFVGNVSASCSGRIINPVTDVCWECLFPITIGNNLPFQTGPFADVETDAEALCACSGEANITLGMNLGFWEPIRTMEIVREPFCFPSLGGVSLGDRTLAPAHGRTPNPKTRGHRTSFYQVHWYHTPWLYLLEILLDTTCLEQSAWDVAYMTELDPLWDDSTSSFLLNPDVTLFFQPHCDWRLQPRLRGGHHALTHKRPLLVCGLRRKPFSLNGVGQRPHHR